MQIIVHDYYTLLVLNVVQQGIFGTECTRHL